MWAFMKNSTHTVVDRGIANNPKTLTGVESIILMGDLLLVEFSQLWLRIVKVKGIIIVIAVYWYVTT